MNVNLSGQGIERDQIAPKLLRLKQLMVERKAIWDRLSDEKRQLWLDRAAAKDPIMDLAWDVYRYLHKNFFAEIEVPEN